VSVFPVPFGVPALACCVIPSPLRTSALLTVGLPGTHAWTSTGLPRSAGMRHDRGGPLLYPGAAVSSRPAGHNRSAPAASQRPALHPRCHNPSARKVVTRHQTEIHTINPSDLSLARSPRTEREPFGVSLGLRTPPLPATHAEAGTGLTDTDPELHLRHSRTSQR
jgi:hypothetical protein